MSAWMGGWVMGETFAIGTVFRSDTPLFANAFILFCLIDWAFGGALVVYTILWQLIGYEKIPIERGVLKIDKSVLGIGRKKVMT